jgi:rRNA processing protein Gar1
MALLYVGLGIVMISGISAMMQIGNNINNMSKMSIVSTYKREKYFKSDYVDTDKEILKILSKISGSVDDVCGEVKDKLNNEEKNYDEGEDFLSKEKSISMQNFFNGSCTLINKKHRVLIKKNDLDNYEMFSCYLDGEMYCPFEEDPSNIK